MCLQLISDSFFSFLMCFLKISNKVVARGTVLAGMISINLMSGLSAQPTVINLQEAVKLGIENNYDVKNAHNNVAISQNNASLGAVGLLPNIALNSSSNNSINSTHQEFINGPAQNKDNARSNSINVGPAMSWSIFDGNNSFYEYKTNKAITETSKLAEKVTLQTLVAQIYRAYYQTVFQKSLIITLKQTSKIFEERARVADLRTQIGTGTKTDFYQAQIDLNTVESEVLRQHKIYNQYLNQLKEILVINPDNVIDVADSLIQLSNVNPENLKQQINTASPVITYNNSVVGLNERYKILANSQRLPTLTFNLGYNLLYSQSQSGQVVSNRSMGPTYGFNFSLPIFYGNYVNRSVNFAKINIAIASNTLNAIKQRENVAFNRYYSDHNDNLKILAIESRNLELSKASVDIGIDKYKNDKLSGIELQLIVKTNLDVKNRLLTAYRDAKITEIELLNISGELVK